MDDVKILISKQRFEIENSISKMPDGPDKLRILKKYKKIISKFE